MPSSIGSSSSRPSISPPNSISTSLSPATAALPSPISSSPSGSVAFESAAGTSLRGTDVNGGGNGPDFPFPFTFGETTTDSFPFATLGFFDLSDLTLSRNTSVGPFRSIPLTWEKKESICERTHFVVHFEARRPYRRTQALQG